VKKALFGGGSIIDNNRWIRLAYTCEL
jgi:hypothetical protein